MSRQQVMKSIEQKATDDEEIQVAPALTHLSLDPVGTLQTLVVCSAWPLKYNVHTRNGEWK